MPCRSCDREPAAAPEPTNLARLSRREPTPAEIVASAATAHLRWAYGVTTVPSRFPDLLPRTLDSLARAGFDCPWLFVDGADESVAAECRQRFGLAVTARFPAVRTVGNWILSLWELYVRNPAADRYAIFQDDIIASAGLRDYLDVCIYPPRTYWNLYTATSNERVVRRLHAAAPQFAGWAASDQNGMGALALVFDRATVAALLSSRHLVGKPQDAQHGHRNVDGTIVASLKQQGWRELVHVPSLVQHVGHHSSMGNNFKRESETFRGEAFDCRDFIRGGP